MQHAIIGRAHIFRNTKLHIPVHILYINKFLFTKRSSNNGNLFTQSLQVQHPFMQQHLLDAT